MIIEDKAPSLFELYARERRLLKNNCVKYHIFTTILDYLVYCKYLFHKEHVTEDDVIKWLDKRSTKDFELSVPYALIQLWIREMIWLDLITFDDKTKEINLTSHGYDMYKSQQFHFSYASLLEAKSSRNLSKMVMWLSMIAIVIAIVGLLID